MRDQKTYKGINDKYKYSTSQLFNFTQDSYLDRTSRPVYAMVFLLPFIVFYELGTIFINTDVLDQSRIRVVAFVWLQNMLEYLGTGSRFAWAAPPLAVIAILLSLQLVSRKRWYFNIKDILPMTIECIMLAVPLIVFSLLLSGPAQPQSGIANQYSTAQVQGETILSCSTSAVVDLSSTAEDTNSIIVDGKSLLADIVTGIGAGIYEELLFRLILICFLMLLFQDIFRLSHKNSIVLSVLVSAALFSAHHHIVFINGQISASAPFNWTEFGFRIIAGVYFAILFAIRGFGVTAGTHAFYDIIATVVNAVFFQQ